MGEFKKLGTAFRFEKLDITPRSAIKIRPVLENWLKEAEEKQKQQCTDRLGCLGESGAYAGISSTNMINKIRKRRTFFSSDALVVLNAHFAANSHPSGDVI